jgi:heat shock protein HspQ
VTTDLKGVSRDEKYKLFRQKTHLLLPLAGLYVVVMPALAYTIAWIRQALPVDKATARVSSE